MSTWQSKLNLPVGGLPDELFSYAHAHDSKTAQNMGVWGSRWRLIKALNSKDVGENREKILKLLNKYSANFKTFLNDAWRNPPLQSRAVSFKWGDLESHSVVFEKVMLANTAIQALLPDKAWPEIQQLCAETITDLKNWRYNDVNDVSCSIPYYQSLHAYAGFQQCLPKLNEALAGYPKSDFQHGLRVATHALKFLEKSENYLSLDPTNRWHGDFTALQGMSWHLAALAAVAPQENPERSAEMALNLEEGKLSALIHDQINKELLPAAIYAMNKHGVNELKLSDTFEGLDNVFSFAATARDQVAYLSDLEMRFDEFTPKADCSADYEAQLQQLVESVEIVKA